MEPDTYTSPRSEVYFRDHPEDYAIKDAHWHNKGRLYTAQRLMRAIMARVGVPQDLRQDSGWPW